MAGCLSPFFRVVLGGLLFAAATIAPAAEEIRDPTRPIDAAPGAGGYAEMQPSSGLQSIVRRQGAQPQAVINGELVPLGGKVGQARLVRIDDNAVVLQTATGRETLTLTPGVEKTRPKKPAPAKKRTAPAAASRSQQAP